MSYIQISTAQGTHPNSFTSLGLTLCLWPHSYIWTMLLYTDVDFPLCFFVMFSHFVAHMQKNAHNSVAHEISECLALRSTQNKLLSPQT